MNVFSPEKQLTQDRQETLKILEKLRAELRSEVEFDADEYNPDLFEREKAVSTIQMLEHQLARIEQALERVQAGEYGICRDCGQPIEIGRLEVVPESTRCLSCKSKAEHGLY